jgi:hypothetical protein
VADTSNDQIGADAGTRPRQVAPACRGYCPGLRTGAPVLCEGSCSNLTGWLLEAGWVTVARDRSRARLNALLVTLAMPLLLGLVGCDTASSAAGDVKPYALTVKGPASGKLNAPLVATIRVLPKGGYKMNLEFPTKLKVAGPASATPPQLELTAKQAAKLTKAELLLKPTFKVNAPGVHAFAGTLRFSVCTEKLCELKSEAVKWTVSVTQ